MANEAKVTKWHSGVLIDIELREKVMKKYGKGCKSKSEAIALALEDSVKGVRLTPSELAKIREEIERNYQSRMRKRELNAAGVSAGGRKRRVASRRVAAGSDSRK